jgi:8-oxo-dGTP diphosphatase
MVKKMDHDCVGAILVEKDAEARLLLAKRASTRTFYPDVWDLPGGHRESGETPDQTLVRELEEEVGITPTKWRPLQTLCLSAWGGDGRVLLHTFVVTEWVRVPSNCSTEEHAKIAWFTIEDACKLALADSAYPALFKAALTARGE